MLSLSMDETVDVLKATFSLVTTSIGVGMVTVPYAFSVFGWWTLIIIAGVSGFMLFGGLLLDETLRVSKSFTFLGMAEEHLGPLGRIVVQAAFFFTTYFVAIILVILTATSFQSIFAEVSDLSYIVWVLISTVLMWGIGLLPEVKDMAAVLGFAAFCSYAVAAVILVEAGMDLGEPIEFKTPANLDLDMGVQGISVFIFANTFSVLVPSTRRNMKYPKNSRYPIYLVVVCLMVIYVLVGSINFAAYGCEVPSNILTKWNRNAAWYIANILLCGHLLVAGPLLLNPFVVIVETLLLKIEINYTHAETVDTPQSTGEVTVVDSNKAETGTSAFEAEIDKMPVKQPNHEERLYGEETKCEEEGNWFYRNRFGMGRVVLRTIVWASICFIAILIPFISALEEAVVGLALVSQTLVIPIITYYVIYKDSVSMTWKIFCGTVAVGFTVFAIGATYYSIYSIVDAASSFKIFQVPPDDSTYLCSA
eukprot:Clim_evm87s144 gene=Clim_evmTU87s144